jgi:hypothetical protein
MQQVSSFHFDMDIQMTLSLGGSSLDVPLTFVGEFQGPDRIKAVMSLTLPFIAIETEIVSIGDTTYTKDPETGEWDVSVGEDAFFIAPDEFFGEDVTDLSDLAIVGVVTLAGVELYHLKGTAPPGTFSESDSDFDISFWIGVDDGLLAQVVAAGEFELDEDDSLFGDIAAGTATLSLTVKFSDFGAEVTIEPPEDAPSPASAEMAAERSTVQTAMDSMMADKGIASVSRSADSTNDWSALPTGPGAAPLAGYMAADTTTYFYCWDESGEVLFQDVSATPCFPPESPTSAPAPAGVTEEAEIETLRQLSDDYWEAFNNWDADTALSYLEESYRAERESDIRRDIGRLKTFNVKLGLSVERPPELTSSVAAQMSVKMREPLGTRLILLTFIKVDGQWVITHAEEEK